MLSLDSPEWRQLNHAYGPASDTPPLIERLALNAGPKTDYQAEPWFTLWSSLCHQGDVYSASYAAVPHLVRICLEAPGPIDFGFFLLPACVEIARVGGRGPEMPQQLRQAYSDALSKLHDCAYRHAAQDWDSDMAQSVAAALAAAKGQIKLAEALVNLDEEAMDRIIDGEE